MQLISKLFDFESSVGACAGHWQRENCVRNLSTTSVGASSHPHCQFSVSSQGGDAGDRISDRLTDTLVQICLSREGDGT